MPQLNKGDTFADGQQVTGARLNQLVDSATVLPGVITEQAAVAANDVQIGDQILAYDNSAAALCKISVGDIMGANLVGTFSDVVTDDVSAKTGNDVIITPNSKTAVLGRSYTSTVSSGVTTVVVTHVSHGLAVGSFVSVTSATNSLLNGTYRVSATLSADTFSYVVYGSTTSGSGTLTYTKLASTRNEGNMNINGGCAIIGDQLVSGNATFLGTGALALPSGTTAQRPGAPAVGMIRYNNQTSQAEVYNGTAWEEVGGGPFDGTGGDIVIAPEATVNSTGVTFSCANGYDIVVTHVGHTVSIGQVVLLTTTQAGYTGEWPCVSVSGNTFTLKSNIAQLPVGSTNASYRKSGNFKCHIWTSVGASTFTAGNKSGYIEVLVVGSGSSGGSYGGVSAIANGGGGGVAYFQRYFVQANQTISLSVGNVGSSSTFGTLVANQGTPSGYLTSGSCGSSTTSPSFSGVFLSAVDGYWNSGGSAYRSGFGTTMLGIPAVFGLGGNALFALNPTELPYFSNSGTGGGSWYGAGCARGNNCISPQKGIVAVRYPYWI